MDRSRALSSVKCSGMNSRVSTYDCAMQSTPEKYLYFDFLYKKKKFERLVWRSVSPKTAG